MKSFSKITAAVTTVLFLASCSAGSGSNGSADARANCFPATEGSPLEGTLVVNTAGGAFSDALNKAFFEPFEKDCGVKVTVTETPKRTFTQLVQWAESGNPPFDLGDTFVPQEFGQGLAEDIFEPLPENFWSGLEDKMIEGSHHEYGVWGPPYATTMIASTKEFPDGINSWADFWDLGKNPGPRTLQDDASNVVFALMADGVAPKDIYPITKEKAIRAFKKLDEIRPAVRAYWTSGDQPVQGIANGEFVAGTAWNGRAYAGIDQGFPISVNWEAGSLINTLWWFIPKGAKNPAAAQALMHYMQKPERQAEMANIIGYSGASTEVDKLLPQEKLDRLPTSPEHLATASPIDSAWWAENSEWIQSAWSQWKATGSSGL